MHFPIYVLLFDFSIVKLHGHRVVEKVLRNAPKPQSIAKSQMYRPEQKAHNKANHKPPVEGFDNKNQIDNPLIK